MPIEINWVGSGPGLARWQNALAIARTTNAFNQLEAKLALDGVTQVTINVTEAFVGMLTRNYVEAANYETRTLNLHPTNAAYVDRVDGTRGPVPDAATLGHGLAHLTAGRIPGATMFDNREELRVLGTEDAITTELHGSPRASLPFWGKLLDAIGGAPGVVPGLPAVNRCFSSGTPILLADGTTKPIERIEVGDFVLAFDSRKAKGQGALEACRVTRLFRNVTDEWLELSPAPSCRLVAQAAGFSSLTVTPGHSFLTPDGSFEQIGRIIAAAERSGTRGCAGDWRDNKCRRKVDCT